VLGVALPLGSVSAWWILRSWLMSFESGPQCADLDFGLAVASYFGLTNLG
jgi:hypothetical protein